MSNKPNYEELEKEINELRREKETFRIERDELQSLMNGLSRAEIGIDIVRIDYTVLFQNKILKERFGNLTGQLCYEKYMGLEEPCDFCPMIKAVKNNQIESAELIGNDGRNYEVLSTPLPNPDGTVEKAIEVIRDITKRKQAEKSLRIEKEFTETALNAQQDTFFLFELATGKAIRWNRAFKNITGYIDEEIEGMVAPDSYYNPDDLERAGIFIQDILKKSVGTIELELLCRDGHKVPTEYNVSVIKDKEGRPKYLISIGRDVTERRRADEEKRSSEEKFKALFNASGDGILVADIEGLKFIEANPAICKMLGYSRAELLSKKVTDIHPIESLKQVIKDFEAQARGEKLVAENIPCLTKHGVIIFVDISTVKTRIMGRDCNIGFFRDITDRRKLEEKLLQSQKMESLGLLAGGVAHDLNNILSGIVSYPELILLDLPEDSKFKKPIETMQESGHRAVAIVQDLLTIARGVAIAKKPLNLNGLIRDYLNSPEFKNVEQNHPAVTVHRNLEKNLLNINGSHIHIRKALMNLVLNASEAIEGSGNITISTVNTYVDKPLRGYEHIHIGEYVLLTVSDDGSGISSCDLRRIFEPFYTKKIMGKSGTGLGLTVVWNTVQDHEGYICVKNDENGTTFQLYFPITRDEISDRYLSIPIKDYRGNGEKILIVDDVESQREISCKMLDTLGYEAIAVSSGEEAVEYLKERTVDLLLLDMIMDPGINGTETYERVIEIYPKQKAIIVSGFAETNEVQKAQKLGAGQYVKKPLTLERIGIAVKQELGKS